MSEELYSKFPDLERYLALVNQSDRAFYELTSLLEKSSQKYIVLMFGDHQPKLRDEFYKEYGCENGKGMLQKHKLQYYIWSNYKLKDEKVYEETSPNYLLNLLFSILEFPKSSNMIFLNELYKIFPVITGNGVINNAGQYYGKNEIINNPDICEYNALAYNHLIDNKGYTDDIFGGHDGEY